jgi:hypothetical protein
VWTIPTLPVGMTAQVQIVAQVAQTGQVQAAAAAAGAGIDPATSQLDATAALSVMKTNQPATWSYFTGVGPKPATTPAVPMASTPTPSHPVLPTPPASSTVARLLLARGFILPAAFHL